MRLTKDLRSLFVHAVMADVPKIDYDDLIRKKATNTALEVLPHDVRRLWGDESMRSFVASCTVSMEIYSQSGGYLRSISVFVPGHDIDVLFSLIRQACAQLMKDYGVQCETHTKLRKDLEVAVSNINTSEELAKVFPEFEKYVPKNPAKATRNLPALANVVSEFTKAGWPKDGAKEAVAQA